MKGKGVTRPELEDFKGKRVYAEGYYQEITEAEKGGYRVLLTPVYIYEYGSWKNGIKLDHVWVYHNEAINPSEVLEKKVTRLTKMWFVARVEEYRRKDHTRDYGLEVLEHETLGGLELKGLNVLKTGKVIQLQNQVTKELEKIESTNVILPKQYGDLQRYEKELRKLEVELQRLISALKIQEQKKSRGSKLKKRKKKSNIEMMRELSCN